MNTLARENKHARHVMYTWASADPVIVREPEQKATKPNQSAPTLEHVLEQISVRSLSLSVALTHASSEEKHKARISVPLFPVCAQSNLFRVQAITMLPNC